MAIPQGKPNGWGHLLLSLGEASGSTPSQAKWQKTQGDFYWVTNKFEPKTVEAFTWSVTTNRFEPKMIGLSRGHQWVWTDDSRTFIITNRCKPKAVGLSPGHPWVWEPKAIEFSTTLQQVWSLNLRPLVVPSSGCAIEPSPPGGYCPKIFIFDNFFKGSTLNEVDYCQPSQSPSPL